MGQRGTAIILQGTQEWIGIRQILCSRQATIIGTLQIGTGRRERAAASAVVTGVVRDNCILKGHGASVIDAVAGRRNTESKIIADSDVGKGHSASVGGPAAAIRDNGGRRVATDSRVRQRHGASSKNAAAAGTGGGVTTDRGVRECQLTDAAIEDTASPSCGVISDAAIRYGHHATLIVEDTTPQAAIPILNRHAGDLYRDAKAMGFCDMKHPGNPTTVDDGVRGPTARDRKTVRYTQGWHIQVVRARRQRDRVCSRQGIRFLDRRP